ncbi:MAG TPA: threonine/serine dehydratase [Ktedonobacterales bacterium]|nr:threonine/serine dehydratase [Ktedonobacterales bacterium]
MMVTLNDVLEAQRLIAGRVHRTPLLSAHSLGNMVSPPVQLYVKAELLQKTGSFKARGALNKVLSLTDAQKRQGLITVSAGNHAQAAAWAGANEGVAVTVVMPEVAVRSKIEATRGYGAEVVLFGKTPTVLFDHAHQLERERGLHFIHAYDDPRIVAGAGTTGLEILEDLPDADVVIVPCGGGGLISGIAVAIKERRPQARIILVEPEGAPTMHNAVAAGKSVPLEKVSTIADGLTAPFAGELNLAIVQRYVDQMVLVTDDEISAALLLVLERCKFQAEPAAAASVAALLSGKTQVAEGEKVVAVLSGGNIDRDRLKSLL